MESFKGNKAPFKIYKMLSDLSTNTESPRKNEILTE